MIKLVHVIFAAAILLSACSVGKGRNRTYLCWLSFLVLFLFSALRYDFGNDYMSYYNNFVAIKHGNWSAYGSQYVFTLINYLSPSFPFLVAVTSFLFLWAVYRLLKDHLPPEHIWLGLFVFLFSPYIFLMNLSAMRQCLAMLLFMLAIPRAASMSTKGFVRYAALILLASFIHKSAILLLPVYFFANNKSIKRLHMGLIFAATALLLLSENLFPTLVSSVLSIFDDKNYVDYFAFGAKNSLRSILLSLIPVAYLLLNASRVPERNLVYTKLSVASYLLSILAFQNNVLIRMRMYFEIFSVVAVPMTYFAVKELLPEEKEPLGAGRRFFLIINRYALPALVFLIYLLKYYNFFQEPVWEPFLTYKTILWR